MHPHKNVPPKFLVRLGLALLLVTTSISLPLPQAAAAGTFAIYGDSLAAGWGNWSWDVTFSAASTNPTPHTGSAAMAAAITGAWGGLYLHTDSAVPASGYTAIQFWIHGGSSGGQALTFRVIDSADGESSVAVTAPAGTWTQVTVALAALGNPADIAGLQWQDAKGQAWPAFYVDDVALVTSAPPTSSLGPALTVDATADQRAISPYIYGMNYAKEDLAADLRLPVRRWGGNSTSRYNWQNDTTNTGNDWYFENVPVNPGADGFVAQNVRTQSQTLLTVPLIGWVAKRRLNSHPYDCGFKRSKYGNQTDADWSYDSDCGNGVLASTGQNITGNDPADTSVATTPAFVSSWVSHLVSTYGTAASGGVKFYNLDNEPGIWNGTHRDVHPNGTTYAEMVNQTYAYAAAVKSADPTALTLGPVEDGWCRYFFSGRDGCSPSGPDYSAHGVYIDWYLQQMKLYEQQHSQRILDYLDLHIYPQGAGIFSDSAGDAATQALRLRSTRQLWDPTYVDESWIENMGWQGGTVQLIPRMHAWVNTNYPGTKLAISEYSWGALNTMNGALAQADVLGIFGREGLDLATLWGPPSTSQPGAYAFRMYLNYDGAHSHFGETSVRAASANQAQVAIYAARRAADGALTLMIINKTSAALTSAISLAHFAPAPNAQVFRYSPSNFLAVEHQPDQAVGATGFTATYPANSITLVIIPPAGTLSISKAVSPAQNVQYGQTITYTLVISGDGHTAQLADPLPAGLTYVAGSLSAVSPPAVYVSASRTISWTGTIPSNGLSLTFRAQPTGGTGLAPVLNNTATLTDTATGRAEWASALLNGYAVFVPTVLR
jgi:uncharacterized repeat protein (TIGR01451 family)